MPLRPRVKTVPLTRRMLVFRWRALLLVALLGAALSASLVTIVGLRAASLRAVEDSATSNQAGRAYTVQAGTRVSRQTLTRIAQLDPVWTMDASVRTQDRLVPAVLREFREPGPDFGVRVAGRQPSNASEISISRGVAEGLGVGLADSVAVVVDGVEGPARTIVGLTVDPADRRAQFVTGIESGLDPGGATVWLSDTEPYEIPQLLPLLDSRVATFQSVEALRQDAEQRLPEGLRDLRLAPWGLAGLLAVLLSATLFTLRPIAERDVSVLRAAGMSSQQAWDVVIRLVTGALVVGQVAGALASVAAIRAFKDELSALFGQVWFATPTPRGWLLGLPIATVGLILISRRFALARLPLSRTLLGKRGSAVVRRFGAAHVVLCLGLLILVACGLATRSQPPGELTQLAPVGAVLVAVGIPRLVLPVCLVGFPRVSRRVAGDLLLGMYRPMMVVCVLVTIAGVHTATVNQDTTTFEASMQAPQPPGSLLISPMPNGAAEQLVADYTAIDGAKALRLEFPLEDERQVRVTGAQLVACMAEAGTTDPNAVPPSCFPMSTYAPVNRVAFSATNAEPSRADPGLVDDGRVGVLQFDVGQGTATRTGTAAALADATLGGNMPGLVISPSSDLARQYDLHPSGSSLVALLDFGSLPAPDRAAIRSEILRLAPSAETIDGTGESGYQRSRAVADGQALAVAALALLLLLATGGVVRSASRRTLRIMVETGARAGVRRRFALRWGLFPLSCFLLMVPLTLLTTMISGIGHLADIGYLWLAPIGAVGLTGLILPTLLVRVPSRVGE